MRRLIGVVFILVVIAAAGLVGYSYVVDLPAPTAPMEAPASGVGFSD